MPPPVNTLYEVVDNLSHQAGARALRAGIDILHNDDTIGQVTAVGEPRSGQFGLRLRFW